MLTPLSLHQCGNSNVETNHQQFESIILQQCGNRSRVTLLTPLFFINMEIVYTVSPFTILL